ncbi:MAG: tetratricopeptide repeat protein [Terriglobia bacterium]
MARARLAHARKAVDPRVAQAMKLYEEAMRHFNRQGFRRAKEMFEKVVAGPSRELAERARVHIAICEQRLQRPAPVHLRSAEDHYHYGVSQINRANYPEARAHLEKARKLTPKADHIYYALASVAALSGEAEEALEYLAQAIKLRPENRYHARNDADFKLLEDEARFQELLYPERLIGPKVGELHA